jgi:hypothetical protein
MASSDPAALIILGEIAALQSIALIAIAVLFILHKRKKSRKLGEIMNKISEGEQERKTYISKVFNPSGNIPSDQMQPVCNSIIEAEKTFYEEAIVALFNNDLDKLESIDIAVSNLTKPYEQFVSISVNERDKIEAETSEKHDVNDAIDVLLADEAEDPELDLSNDNSSGSTDEIAEIPDDLLSESGSFPDLDKEK